MIQVEAEGRTLEEALNRASEELGVVLGHVGYEVLETKGGFLGILGRKKVRIRAWVKQAETQELRAFLEGLFRKAGLECRVCRVEATDEKLGLEVDGEDSELLVRRDGELLEALGYLAERALRKKTGKHTRVVVDAGGFRARREQELREKALQAAKEALKRGSAALGPLNARDRRMVHLFLKERPGLASRSVGQGPLRKVLITKEASPVHGDEERLPR